MEIKTKKDVIEEVKTVTVMKTVETKQFILTEKEMAAIILLLAPIKMVDIHSLVLQGGELFGFSKNDIEPKEFKYTLLDIYSCTDKRKLLAKVFDAKVSRKE